MPILASGAACCEAGVENDEDQAVAYPLRHHERPNSYPTIPAWKVFEASKKITFAAPQMESDEVRWMDIAEPFCFDWCSAGTRTGEGAGRMGTLLQPET